MKIIRIDEDTKVEKTVANGLSEQEAIDKVIAVADGERRNIPNNPMIVASGPNAISIAIGVYKIVTYEVVE